MSFTESQIQSLIFLGLGVLVVLGTSFLKNINWSKKQKHSIAVILSALTGVVSSYFKKNGTGDLTSIAENSAYLYAISQIAYVFVLGNTTLDTWLTKFNILPSSNRSEN